MITKPLNMAGIVRRKGGEYLPISFNLKLKQTCVKNRRSRTALKGSKTDREQKLFRAA